MGRVNNKEKYKEYDHNYYVKHKRPKSKIGQAELKIADLEAKLAEKENEIKTLICDYESRITKTHELMSWLEHENEELKQQLAEKDKDIKQLKGIVDTIDKFKQCDVDMTDYVIINPKTTIVDGISMENYIELKQNQTQLAIQELEKVKSWCEENSDDLDDGETDERVCSAIGLDKPIVTGDMALYDFIDQQINELKGEKE